MALFTSKGWARAWLLALVVAGLVLARMAGRIPAVEGLGMSRHMRAVAASAGGPSGDPSAMGDVVITSNGAVFQAVRGTYGGLSPVPFAWELVAQSSAAATVVAEALTPTQAATATLGGMLLTGNANGALNLDGQTTGWAVGDRVLLMGQGDATQNGIWSIAQVGDGSNPFILTRPDDARIAGAFPASRLIRSIKSNALYAPAPSSSPLPVPGTDALRFAPLSGEGSETLPSNVEVGTTFAVELTFMAPGAGAQDVPILGGSVAGLPYAFDVLSTSIIVSTAAGAGATGQLRGATGGGGSPLSGPIAVDATGRALEGAGGGLTAVPLVNAGGTVVLRLSDGTAAGTVTILGRRK